MTSGERKALTMEQALEIFRRRSDNKANSTLLAETAEEFGVTQTSIRHIWGRKSWKSTTMPFWTEEERASSISDGLCQQCLNGGQTDIEQACPACPINRKRGRPVGTKDSYKRHRTSAAEVSQLVGGGGVEGLQLAGVGGMEGSKGLQGNSGRMSGTTRMTGKPDADELRQQPSAAAGVRIRGTLAVAGRGLYVTDACQVLLDLYHGCEIGLQGQSLLLFLLPASAQEVYDALNSALETGATSQATSHMLLPARSDCPLGSFLPCSMHATPKAHGRGELIISVELHTQTDESPCARHTPTPIHPAGDGRAHRRRAKLDAHPHEGCQGTPSAACASTPSTQRARTAGLSREALDVKRPQSLEGSPPSGSASGNGRGGVYSSDLRHFGVSYAFNKLESTSAFGEVMQHIHLATSYEAPNLFSKWALAVGGFVTRAAQTMRLGWLLDATTGSGLEKVLMDAAVFSLDFPDVAQVCCARSRDCASRDCPAKFKWTVGARKNVFGIPLHANVVSHELLSVQGCRVIRCRVIRCSVHGTGL
jgi:hypothetical protein